MSPLPGSVLGKTWRERSLWKGLLERTRGTGALYEEEVVQILPREGKWGSGENAGAPEAPG